MEAVTVHAAAKTNDVDALRLLLNARPELVETYDDNRRPRQPLYYAAEAGHLDATELLLDRGADIDNADESNITALLGACRAGRAGTVALLLERGADPTRRDMFRRTTLMLAAYGNERAGSDHLAVIKLLLKDGRVSVDRRDDKGCTALGWAIFYRRQERARVLVMQGPADLRNPGFENLTYNPVSVQKARECHEQVRKWLDDESMKHFLLLKARSVVEAAEVIINAPEKRKAKTEPEAQKARKEAAPAYLRRRVRKCKALPGVKVIGQAVEYEHPEEMEDGEWAAEDEKEEETKAVIEHIVRWMKEDLFVELMQGLWYSS